MARHQTKPFQRDVYRMRAQCLQCKSLLSAASNSTQDVQGQCSCTWRRARKASEGARGAQADGSGKAPLGLACGAFSKLDRSVGLEGSLREAASAPQSHYLGQWKGQRTREGCFGLFILIKSIKHKMCLFKCSGIQHIDVLVPLLQPSVSRSPFIFPNRESPPLNSHFPSPNCCTHHFTSCP